MGVTNTTSTATIVAVAFAGLAGAAWLLTDYVNANLANLPVERVQSATAAAEVFDVKGWLKTMSPVWVESAEKSHLSNDADSVEGMFMQVRQVAAADSPAAAPMPSEPDYAAMLPSRMQLDGLGEGGAFINGKFYRVGEEIPDFEYPSKGRQIVPVLEKIGERSATVKHGSRLTELRA